ncbi:BPL-N domain-containing protein [Streptomyces sp. NPDC088337]|uniref:BPL-N domain-containing protein n=1 Tax=unclassified Streptomyces TaxID=2593676 RepID=UPI002DDA7565|nr:BPL-N domain-containing protein [Streptomyces sp. NBC_01788]WSB30685.1 BPL-N domain-containing protein [Streptomyces sp. NBC_01788]
MTHPGHPGAAAGRRPLALVYRGPASLPGCPEAVAALLSSGPWNLDVRYTGPNEALPLSAEILTEAALYAQPGGGTLASAYRRLRRRRREIRDFVRDGGRYLGFCLGGYLAGATPGFGLLPGDTDQYISSPGATVHDESDTLVTVNWGGRPRTVFFQDGPFFVLDEHADATVLATYDNGTPAALVTPFGRGRVAVTGPHPEATTDWYTDHGLPVHDTLDLAMDLVESVMEE